MFVKCNVTDLLQAKVNKSTELGPNVRIPVMPVTLEILWPAAREMLRNMLNPDIFNLWFAPIRATALEGDLLTLEVANDFCEVWLKDNYLGLIQDVLMHASGQPLKVRFKVVATQPGATSTTESKAHKANAVEDREESVASCRDHGFNPKNTFDTFVVGNNNNFAHAAALAVAQGPGKSYNPLFLYGGVGLGKTHLLHAIGQHVVKHKK